MQEEAGKNSSDAKFRELFEKSRDAFLIIENGIFTDYNQASLDMLGYKDKQGLLGKHPAALSPELQPDGRPSLEKAKEMMDLALKNGNHRFEWEHVRANGEHFPLEISLTTITNRPGQKILHVVWRDITEQKQKSEALIEAKHKAEENERLKSAFLANMSHEIRTPLNAILGFSGLLKDENFMPEKKLEFANIIESAGNQLMTIISDILDLSKLDAGQITLNKGVVNLNGLMDKLYKTNSIGLEEGKVKMKVEKGLDDAASNVISDSVRLSQIMNNLLSNARKHTHEGEITLGYSSQGPHLVFYVKDTGMGIPKKDHKLIFERFGQVIREEKGFTKGTGLGLAICKGLIALFGGRIWVESEEGKGSSFYFEIPFEGYVQKKADPLREVSTDDIDFSGYKCLVAEDEDTNYFFLEALLSNKNMKLIRASNGAEALALYEENPDIDLVLMDIRMPKLNGMEVTKKIKAQRPGLPVIAQTAYAMKEDKDQMKLAGSDAIITKPIDEQELLKTLERFLR